METLLLINVQGFQESGLSEPWRWWQAEGFPDELAALLREYRADLEWRSFKGTRPGVQEDCVPGKGRAQAGLRVVWAPVTLGANPSHRHWSWQPSTTGGVPLKAAWLIPLPCPMPQPPSGRVSFQRFADVLMASGALELMLRPVLQFIEQLKAMTTATRTEAYRRWRLLGGHLEILLGTSSTPLPQAGAPRLRMGTLDDIQADPCCDDALSVGEWLNACCSPIVVRVTGRTKVVDASMVARALRHDEKHLTLSDLRSSSVIWRHVIRATVFSHQPCRLHVVARASDLMLREMPELYSYFGGNPDQETLRHNALWMCPVQTALQCAESGRVLSWEHGHLHITTAAPQTWFGQLQFSIDPAVQFGELKSIDLLVVFLGFVGPTVFGYEALKHALPFLSAGGAPPCRQMFGVTSPAPPPQSPGVLKTLLDESNFLRLPLELLRRLDDEQISLLRHFGESTNPCLAIQALAGTGKSQVLRALLWLWCHTPQATAGGLAVFTLQSRTLRQEFFDDLMGSGLFDTNVLIWLGRPPPDVPKGSVQTDGSLEDLVIQRLGAGVKTTLDRLTSELDALHLRLEAHVQHVWDWLHPPNRVTEPGVTRAVLLELENSLRSAAGEAMRLLFCDIFLGWPEAAKKACDEVVLVLATVDQTMKICAKLFSTKIAKKLFSMKSISLLGLDEVQRSRLWQLGVLAQHCSTLIAAGDPMQRLTLMGSSGARLDDEIGQGPGLVGEQVSTATYTGDLWAFDPGRFDVQVISGCKRCREPLIGYLVRLYGERLATFRASFDDHRTDLTHVLYSNVDWQSAGDLGAVTSGSAMDQQHRLRCVVWAPHLLLALLGQVLQLLSAEEAQIRATNGTWDPHQPIIFVGFALRRLAGPFAMLLRESLEWSELRTVFNLQLSTPANATVRLGADSTGPTFKFGIILLHRRYVGLDAPDAHCGIQCDQNLAYVQMTRATHALWVWMEEDQLQVDTRTRGRDRAVRFLNERVDVAREMGLPVVRVDLCRADSTVAFLNGITGRLLTEQAWTSLNEMLVWVRTTKAKDLLDAANLGEPLGVVEDVVRALPKSDLVRTERVELRQAMLHTAGIQVVLRSFRQHSAPTSFGMLCADWPELWLLGRGLVDCATALTQLGGRKPSIQLALSMTQFHINRLRFDDVPKAAPANVNPASGVFLADCNGCPALRMLVSFVWALTFHLCQVGLCSDVPDELVQQSRLHKATLVQERSDSDSSSGSGDEDDNLVWFTKSCSSNREAVTLTNRDAAVAAWQQAQARHADVPEFTRAKHISLYAYFGGGVLWQPERVGAVVLRTSRVSMAISTLLSARVLSLAGCADSGSTVNLRPELLHAVLDDGGTAPDAVLWNGLVTAADALHIPLEGDPGPAATERFRSLALSIWSSAKSSTSGSAAGSRPPPASRATPPPPPPPRRPPPSPPARSMPRAPLPNEVPLPQPPVLPPPHHSACPRRRLTIGLDVGGVLLTHTGGGRHEEANWAPGSEDVLSQLLSSGHCVHLLSYVGRNPGAAERWQRRWHALGLLQYFEPHHIHVTNGCKGEVVLARNLPLDVFVDDGLDNLIDVGHACQRLIEEGRHAGPAPRLFLMSRQTSSGPCHQVPLSVVLPFHIQQVDTWHELQQHILGHP